MVIRTIVHFEIPAADVERLSQFYREVFDWEFLKSEVPGIDYWRILTGPQGQSVGGGMYRRAGPDDRPRNFIAVDAIDVAIDRFRAAGGTQIVPKREVPGMGWSFIGADPEGNVIALWESTMPALPAPSKARRRARPARRPARRRGAAAKRGRKRR